MNRRTVLRRKLLAALEGRLPAWIAAFWFLLFVRVSSADAQVLTGQVLEIVSDRPVAAVTLRLYDDKGISRVMAISDHLGNFRLRGPNAGRYQVRAERIGYRTTTTAFIELRADAPVMLTIHLVPDGLPVDTLQVSVRSKGLEPGSSQFARRCSAQSAICFSSQRIASSGAVRTSDVFESVPGLAVTETGGFGQARKTTVRSLVGWKCFVIFLNHHTGELSRVIDLNDLVLDDVAGVEIYPSYREVPKELRQSILAPDIWPMGKSPCGVGIVWTKAAWK